MTDDSDSRSRYAAFISYSRKVDQELAPALEDALERFAKPWNRRRALRVFRDDADLSANTGLWSSITEALADSDALILLASPPAAESKWVGREIEYWRQHRDVDRLLLAPTDGEIVWDEKAGDFDWKSTTALPQALRGVYKEEPRYTDLRPVRESGAFTLDDDRFSDAVADLAATLHERPKDEMYGEQVRQHRRTIRLAWGAAIVLAALAIAAIIAAVLAVRASNRAEAEARVSLSRQLAAQSFVAQQDRRFDLADLLAVQAYEIDPTPQARDALLSAIIAAPHLRTTFQTGDAVEAALSDDRRSLALRTADGRVAVWRPLAGRRVGRSVDLAGEPLAMALSPDGAVLAVGYPRHRVELWNVNSGRRIRELVPGGPVAGPPYDRVLSLDFGAGHRQLVWNLEFEVALWNGGDVERVKPPFAPGEAPFEVSLSSDGRRLAVGSQETSAVATWHLGPTGSPTAEPAVLQLGSGMGAARLAFSPTDSDLLAIGGRDGSVQLWDGVRARTLRPAPAARSLVEHLSFSRDGRLLAVVDGEGTSVWNVVRRAQLARELSTFPSALGAHFVTEDRTFASVDRRGAVYLVDLDAPRWPPAPQLIPITDLLEVDISADGSFFAGLNVSGVRLWNTASGRRHRHVIPLPPGEGTNAQLHFDPDSDRLAVWDAAIRVWHAETGTPDGKLIRIGNRGIGEVAFREDGLFAVVDEPGATSRVRLWDVDAEEPASRPVRLGQLSPSFAPDLRFVAVPRQRGTELRELDADRHISNVGRNTFAVAFSHDGSLAAVSDFQGPIRLVDTETGALSGSPLDVGPGRSASTLVFSGDDSMLAAFTLDSSDAGTTPLLGLQLWDVPRRTLISGRSLVESAQHIRGYSGLAFSAHAPKLLTYGLEDRVYVWDFDPDSWSRLACRLAGRDLTREEWSTYAGSGGYEETCE